jgi:hypothetical protein
MKSRSVTVLFLFLASVFACCAFGQTFRGSIQGTVTDISGAVVTGAHVRVFNPGTGLSRTVTTNDQGEYQTSELPLGTYSVTIEKEGYRTTTLNQIPVSVGSPARADAKLATGQVKETVEVNADVPLVETTSDTTGGTIDATQMAELPVNGRDFTKLLELVPGTTSDPMGSTESAGSYGLFSLNGNRGRSNNYLLDGTDMNDGYRNLPAMNQAGVWACPSTILPTDALAEVPVVGSPDAEFGRSSGATVNIVTKSGSNQIHGSGFEYYRDAALGARNYFNTTDQPKNSFTNHQFGGSLGGPLVKDKTFWFLAYEGQRESGGLPQPGTVPNQSYIDTKLATINPVISGLLQTKPWGTLPSLADATNPVAPITFTIPFYNNNDNVIAKFDQHLHLFSSSDLLTGRYLYAHGKQNFPLNMLYSSSSAPAYNVDTPTHVNVGSLSYTTVPKSNVVVEVRAGYNRFLQDFLPADQGFDPNSIGLNTVPFGDASLRDAIHDTGLPTINISGFSTIGATTSAARGRIDTNYQLFGNVSITKGRHNIKVGYEWRRTAINSFIDSGHRGKLNFDSLDDFLAGNIEKGFSAMGAGTRYSFQNGMGTYIQDSWRVNNRITVNAGLRWDYFGVIGTHGNDFSLFNVNTSTLQRVGVAGGPSVLYPKDFTNFGPRVSVADDLKGNGKLVLRAGVGIFYDAPSQDFFVGNQDYNAYGGQAGPAFNNILFGSPVQNQISYGVPVFGTAANNNYLPNSVFTVSQGNVTPRYVSYNLNVESQVAKNIAVQIGYVGSQGRHLYHIRDLDQFNNVDGRTVSCGNGTTVGYEQQCFPTITTGSFVNTELFYVNQIETSALSNYNSMQATLKLQNWHGVTSTLNYTWAHSIDTASDGMDFVPNAAQPEDSFNPHAERASSNFDVRQRVQWYWSYTLPNLVKAKWITNGWALDGSLDFATGQPYTVSFLGEGDLNGSGEYFGRMDIIGNPYAGAHGINLLNLAAFAAPCTWAGTDITGSCASNQHPATEGRNAFTAPNFTDFDFSVTKTSHLTEKLTMELRADFFNLFNHVNLTNPLMPNFGVDAMSGNTQTATINGANRLVGGPGFIQATATPDVASGNPYLGGGGPRMMQLAAHFNF